MDKKKLLIILAAVFVVVVLAVMLVFALTGNDSGNGDETFDLTGTWKVASYTQAGAVTLPDREYFVFSDNTAKAYKEGQAEPYATSSFTLTPGTYPSWDLKLPDISRNYSVTVVTDNYIRLYESKTVYMDLIRYANEDRSDLSYTQDVVAGNWNVAYRNTAETIVDEKLTFEDGTLHDYRKGAEKPVASVPYYWNEEGHICVDALGAQMSCYPYSEDVLFFVEVGTGYIWEIHRAK